MEMITHIAARASLAGIMRKVCQDHVPIIITRENEEPVVMMSLADYRAWKEAVYLLGSPQNAKRLLESLHELENRAGFSRELSTPSCPIENHSERSNSYDTRS